MKVQDLLVEARQPEWAYTEKRVKGALDKVTLSLEGAESGAMTRLAKRYERLDKSAKLLKEKRDQLNAAVKEVGDRIFDAEDALATRIIDTVSYTVMLTASEKAEMKKPTAKVDYESAYSELAKLVPELIEQANRIRAKYTEMIPPKDTPVGLRVKAKVQEGLLTSIKVMWTKFMDSIKQWGRSYDSKLDAIKAKYPTKGKKITEGASPELQAGLEKKIVERVLRTADRSLPHECRHKDFEVVGKSTVHWITQESSKAQAKEAARTLADLIADAGVSDWAVKVVVQDDYDGEQTKWQATAMS